MVVLRVIICNCSSFTSLLSNSPLYEFIYYPSDERLGYCWVFYLLVVFVLIYLCRSVSVYLFSDTDTCVYIKLFYM